MQQIWVSVLRKLREGKQYALFALVSSLDDLTFTADKIVIQTGNQTEYQMLNKNLATLQTLAGGDYLQINAPCTPQQADDYELLEKLQELFGDKLEIW